ncbi:MAG: DUF1365 domain-containing protein [Pseudomonadota bacterium]
MTTPLTKADAPLFPPVDDAARLYPGEVMHARLKPFGHKFVYRVFSVLLDVDRLSEAASTAWFFSVNKRNLVSFHEADHIGKDRETNSLRHYVDSILEEAGIAPPETIKLLAYPRVMNFVFNPLSVYFCYDQSRDLTTAIYEVRNTFGERHTYICEVENGQLTRAGLKQERTKIFYVSPFIDMGMRYHFTIVPPGEKVKLHILEKDNNDPLLVASFDGKSEPFTSRNLARQVGRLPFMTMKIVAGIHWEALKLWLKGAKFHSRGKPPHEISIHDAAKLPAAE